MNTYYFDNENFISTDIYKNFVNNNPEKGSLKIRAYAANEAIPIKGLRIVVSLVLDNNRVIFFDGYTDESGIIENIVLPAPKLVENNLDKPNKTTYEVTTTYEPDALIGKYSVNIYEDIYVVQNISIVPKLNREMEG